MQMSTSHFAPMKPAAQLHVYVPTPPMHVPEFQQGLEAHSSTCDAQSEPSQARCRVTRVLLGITVRTTETRHASTRVCGGAVRQARRAALSSVHARRALTHRGGAVVPHETGRASAGWNGLQLCIDGYMAFAMLTTRVRVASAYLLSTCRPRKPDAAGAGRSVLRRRARPTVLAVVRDADRISAKRALVAILTQARERGRGSARIADAAPVVAELRRARV